MQNPRSLIYEHMLNYNKKIILVNNFLLWKGLIAYAIDAGDLTQGKFRQTPNGRYTYIIEKLNVGNRLHLNVPQ